jgi:hypothetical protein
MFVSAVAESTRSSTFRRRGTNGGDRLLDITFR